MRWRAVHTLAVLIALAAGDARIAGADGFVRDGIDSVEDGIDWIQRRRTFTMNGVPYGLTGLPIVFYTPKSGFHYGGWVEVANYGARPYRYRVNLQWWLSTAGYRNHHIRLEFPRIWRLPVAVRFMTQDLKNTGANFFGIGNDSEIIERRVQQEPDYYRYLLEQQRSGMDLETGMLGPVSLFGGARFNRGVPTRIDETRDNYFFLQQAGLPGLAAGWSNFFVVGIIVDMRNDQELPTSGWMSELSYQKSFDWLGADYLFERYTYLNTHYLPLGRRLTLVNRLVVERLGGEAPFYELTEIGGSIRSFEIGGSAAMRGYESRRFADKQKLLWTTELRRRFKELRIRGQYLRAQTIVFADLGRVAPRFWDLSPLDFHCSGGVGLSATWNSQLTVRVDYAVSPEDRRALVSFGNLF